MNSASKNQDMDSGIESVQDIPKNKEKPEKFPGLFSFLKEHWPSSQDKDTSFLKKGKELLGFFQESKKKLNQNLRTYETISESSDLDKEFFVLLIGSCVISTFGLIQNSSPVIIGAMLIAPLMMPILGLSLSILWGDQRLLFKSVVTLGVGTLISIAIAAILAIIVPGGVIMNEQIQSRTNPTLHDISIALGSGLVGAYAFVNPKVSNSVSGVAIAVALMPPLCAVGLTLGQNQYEAALGALLLYTTNLVGIALAASFVFWRMKVQPMFITQKTVNKRAAANIILSFVLLGLVSFPLAYFMKETIFIKNKESKIKLLVKESLPDAELLSNSVQYFGNSYQIKLNIVHSHSRIASQISNLRKKIKAIFAGERSILKITVLKAFQFDELE